MKKKIIGFFVVMLFTLTAIPTMGLIEENNNGTICYFEIQKKESSDNSQIESLKIIDQIDQQQTQNDGSRIIGDSTQKLAQTFKPSSSTLTKFKIQLQKSTGQAEFASYWVKLYTGTPGGIVFNIYSTSINSNNILTGSYWYEFDIPDQTLSPGITYFFEVYGTAPTIFTTPVSWCYGVNTPYTDGDAYYYSSSTWNLFKFLGVNPCDFCFKTYGPGSGSNNPPNSPSQLSGPSSGNVGETLTYTSYATDPDGDNIKYGIDYHNDGSVDSWSSTYYPSGVIVTFYITFNSVGTYHVCLKAKDIHGAESGFSPPKTVMISGGGNNAPNIPDAPSGSSSGDVGTSYSFSTSATDPDTDQVQYRFDWNASGLHEYSSWTSLGSSGHSDSLSHAWIAAGTYEVKAQARDEHGAESGWSPALTVTIGGGGNTPPNKPDTPTGQTNGNTGTSYTYTTSTDDPEGDQLWYKWDWGDSVSSWDGPYNSGDPVTKSHTWSNQGAFSVKVKAKDTNNNESVWSDPLSVTMPRTKESTYPIQKFFEECPYIFTLLRQFLLRINLLQ